MESVRALNLDGMFVPVSKPEIDFELLTFSGGELHIKLSSGIEYGEVDRVIITHRIRNMNDVMAILIAKDALKRQGVKYFDLVMPYLPYARQDRFEVPGESFTLDVFAELINSAKFDKVFMVDVHSYVGLALIKNSVNISNEFFVQDVLTDFEEKPVLISPDAGASKKANKLAVKFGLDVVQCDKLRDPRTGELSGFQVHAHSLYGRECLIVDDICDGGGTFIGLAQELKRKAAGPIHLAVTHGIFSKGLDIFGGLFKSLYCTNTFSTIYDPRVQQVPLYL